MVKAVEHLIRLVASFTLLGEDLLRLGGDLGLVSFIALNLFCHNNLLQLFVSFNLVFNLILHKLIVGADDALLSYFGLERLFNSLFLLLSLNCFFPLSLFGSLAFFLRTDRSVHAQSFDARVDIDGRTLGEIRGFLKHVVNYWKGNLRLVTT